MENSEVRLRQIEGADLESAFAFDVEEENGFWYDSEDDGLLGIYTELDEYPPEAVRAELFDQALLAAISEAQECDMDDAKEFLDVIESEEDYPEYGISEKFSLFIHVNEHPGVYRTIYEAGELWTGHSSQRRGDRWTF